MIHGFVVLGAVVVCAGSVCGQECVEWETFGGFPARAFAAMAFDEARERVVHFGGLTGVGSLPFSRETYLWDGSRWSLASTSGPSPRAGAAAVYDSERGVVVMFGGQTIQNNVLVDSGETWEWDGSAWTLRAVGGPSARRCSAMVFDSDRNVVVLFGGFGFGDTWEYDGQAWVQRSTTGPRAMSAQSGLLWIDAQTYPAAYDQNRHRTVVLEPVFGSTTTLWEWDGVSWAINPAGTGSVLPRSSAAAFDPSRGIVLTGGVGAGGESTDIWVWDGTTWSISDPNALPARRGHGAVFDSARQRVLVVGGANSQVRLTDTWTLDETGALDLTPDEPAALYDNAMAFDESRGVSVIYGGIGFPGGPANDTWEYDGQAWVRRGVTGPGRRERHAMAYDAVRAVTVLFGGVSAMADTWEWDGQSWTQRDLPGPSARHGHAMAYDRGRGVVVLHGGYNQRDTWEYDGNTWMLRTEFGPTNESSPPLRMAYDESREVCVLLRDAGSAGVVYEWDGVTWTQRQPTLALGCWGPALVYDRNLGAVVAHGGWPEPSGGHLGARDDLWSWDGHGWTLFGNRPESARKLHAHAYDAARGVTVLFGGWKHATGFSGLRDTWEIGVEPFGEIVQQPQDQGVALGEDAALGAQFQYDEPVAYQWYRDNVLVVNGPGPGGGVVSGATTDTLTITGVGVDDAGRYDLRIIGACASRSTRGARLGVQCPSDFDGDGFVTGLDFDGFVAAFEVGSDEADFNGDGFVNGEDFEAFVGGFEEGC